MWFVVKGGWPQMILLFLIMRCTPTIRELIEATPLSPSSPSATSLSALAPAQRAGAQRLCAVAHRVISLRCGIWSLSGHRGHGRTCCWLDPIANDPLAGVTTVRHYHL